MKKHEDRKDQNKVQELENQVKRTLADYQNLEKRVAEERRDWIKSANKDLILKLLPTLDHLETVVKTAKDKGESSSWIEGIEMVVAQFREVLLSEGLTPVQVESFDPEMHEVVEVREGPEGKIIDVVSMGYKLNDKLIQPARVIVGADERSEGARLRSEAETREEI
jgi:molecular chaperone GrpE